MRTGHIFYKINDYLSSLCVPSILQQNSYFQATEKVALIRLKQQTDTDTDTQSRK